MLLRELAHSVDITKPFLHATREWVMMLVIFVFVACCCTINVQSTLLSKHMKQKYSVY